jgi:hypothetical protein
VLHYSSLDNTLNQAQLVAQHIDREREDFMRKSRRWLLASMGASAVGAAARSIEAAARTPAPSSTLKDEKFESDVPLGAMQMPAEIDMQGTLLAKFKLGVVFKGGASAKLEKEAEKLLHDAYDGAEWGGFTQPRWCLVVVQAHVMGQLSAHFAKSGQVKPKNILRAWGLFGRAMSSAGMPLFVEHPDADPKSKKAFKLPRMPNFPVGERCWTEGGIKPLEADQGCELC